MTADSLGRGLHKQTTLVASVTGDGAAARLFRRGMEGKLKDY
jgi:hypothetical protein